MEEDFGNTVLILRPDRSAIIIPAQGEDLLLGKAYEVADAQAELTELELKGLDVKIWGFPTNDLSLSRLREIIKEIYLEEAS